MDLRERPDWSGDSGEGVEVSETKTESDGGCAIIPPAKGKGEKVYTYLFRSPHNTKPVMGVRKDRIELVASRG